MILEVARIDVKADMNKQFETGVAKAAPIFARAKGCHGMELQRSIEHPNRYLLLVKWETVESHTVDFRSSDDFKAWRQLVGHCFEAPPQVEHTELISF